MFSNYKPTNKFTRSQKLLYLLAELDSTIKVLTHWFSRQEKFWNLFYLETKKETSFKLQISGQGRINDFAIKLSSVEYSSYQVNKVSFYVVSYSLQ